MHPRNRLEVIVRGDHWQACSIAVAAISESVELHRGVNARGTAIGDEAGPCPQ
jgi:hypothetical protein